MSIIAQNSTDEVALINHIKKFFTKYQSGRLLKKCNGTKEKGVPAISLLRYKFSNNYILSQQTDLIRLTGITANTLANMDKDEYISMKNLERICKAMNLTPSDILEFVED